MVRYKATTSTEQSKQILPGLVSVSRKGSSSSLTSFFVAMSRGRCRRFATIRQLWLAGISLAAVLLVTGASPANSGNGKGNINGAAESKFHRPGCDCNAIPLKPGPPVCGDDGIEYINPCLAECQGVTVVKNGRCPGRSRALTLCSVLRSRFSVAVLAFLLVIPLHLVSPPALRLLND